MIHFFKTILYNFYQIHLFALGKAKRYEKGAEKGYFAKLLDLVKWFFVEKRINSEYYALGLNLAGYKQEEVIGKQEFLRVKNKAESAMLKASGCSGFSYDIWTKDKYLSTLYLEANGVSCAPVIALVDSSGILYRDGVSAPLDNLFGYNEPVVIKNISLESGDGFMLCKFTNDQVMVNRSLLTKNEFYNKISGGKFILQPRITTHAAIRKLNGTALNSTRIVTIRNGADIEYLGGFQTLATGDAEIDSWSKGAVYVGIDPVNACLRDKGYYSPQHRGGAVVTAHPDSGIPFRGYPIPFLKASVELCLKAHRFYYFNFIIGWDVVITDDGPLILEANEKPGMNAVQIIDGGMKMKIVELARIFS